MSEVEGPAADLALALHVGGVLYYHVLKLQDMPESCEGIHRRSRCPFCHLSPNMLPCHLYIFLHSVVTNEPNLGASSSSARRPGSGENKLKASAHEALKPSKFHPHPSLALCLYQEAQQHSQLVLTSESVVMGSTMSL